MHCKSVVHTDENTPAVTSFTANDHTKRFSKFLSYMRDKESSCCFYNKNSPIWGGPLSPIPYLYPLSGDQDI